MKLHIPLIACLCLAFAACSTSHIIVGKTRPPTNPDDVKVYFHSPQKYEEIALIDSDSNGASPFSQQSKMNAVMSRMKRDAAKLGANGIILTAHGESGTTTVGTAQATANGNNVSAIGISTTRGGLLKTGSCVAIWVTEE